MEKRRGKAIKNGKGKGGGDGERGEEKGRGGGWGETEKHTTAKRVTFRSIPKGNIFKVERIIASPDLAILSPKEGRIA